MKTIVKHRNAFDSLYKRTPSLFYLESIEPTEVQAIERDDFFNLVEHDPSVRKLYEEKLIDRFHAYQQYSSLLFSQEQGCILQVTGTVMNCGIHGLWRIS